MDDLTQDELTELVTLYVLLNQGGWPLTEEQQDDFEYACQILLIVAVMRTGVDVDTAIKQVGRDCNLHVSVENGELTLQAEFDEGSIAITVEESR